MFLYHRFPAIFHNPCHPYLACNNFCYSLVICYFRILNLAPSLTAPKYAKDWEVVLGYIYPGIVHRLHFLRLNRVPSLQARNG